MRGWWDQTALAQRYWRNSPGRSCLVAVLCPHPVTALQSLLRFRCDQKLTGDTPTTLCSISEASNIRVPLLVVFSFPLPEKKTGKEKKKTKKVSSEGEPIADASAEVHKKKKKVCTRPWDGAPWGELF